MAPFSIRFGNEPELSPGDLQELALLAEEAGYDTLWMTEGSGRDSVTQLTSLAAKTKRIGLGTGILPIFGRTPLNTAMCAAGLEWQVHIGARRWQPARGGNRSRYPLPPPGDTPAGDHHNRAETAPR